MLYDVIECYIDVISEHVIKKCYRTKLFYNML